MHDIAKTTNAETDWSVFRNIRNTYIKSVRETKAQYYSNKLTIKNKHKLNSNTNNNNNNQDTFNNNTINTNDTSIRPEVSNINKLWTTVK